mmetsp:Transcript_36042/g.107721  ORF Transcript_36042/g.107721 Transcript_36042/m.107721 type:complete len:274 (-) Transcript_36042:294-1115(-)
MTFRPTLGASSARASGTRDRVGVCCMNCRSHASEKPMEGRPWRTWRAGAAACPFARCSAAGFSTSSSLNVSKGMDSLSAAWLPLLAPEGAAACCASDAPTLCCFRRASGTCVSKERLPMPTSACGVALSRLRCRGSCPWTSEGLRSSCLGSAGFGSAGATCCLGSSWRGSNGLASCCLEDSSWRGSKGLASFCTESGWRGSEGLASSCLGSRRFSSACLGSKDLGSEGLGSAPFSAAPGGRSLLASSLCLLSSSCLNFESSSFASCFWPFCCI